VEGVSLQPKQFRQQTLWPTEAETTHVQGGALPVEMGTAPGDRREDDRGNVEFNVRRALPNGGTSSSWQSPYLRGAYAENARRSATNPVREAELDSGQRAMFMTPREIHQRWEPLMGDRYEGYDSTYDGTDTRSLKPRDEYGTPMEDDDQFWDRKLEESQMDRNEYAMHHRGIGVVAMGSNTENEIERLQDRASYPWQRTGEATDDYIDREESYLDPHIDAYRERKNQSLYDSIAEGGVRSPIRLGEARFSDERKPMVAGGHHRLAAATDIDQDRLVPVLHHASVTEAQSERTGKYYPYD
jgi:hypothetical protein